MQEWHVLVVDDDEQKRSQTAGVLSENSDIRVRTADSLETAMAVVQSEEVDVLVTGYDLRDGTGLELANRVREYSPATGCILYTSAENVETESFEETVVEFVPKDAPDATETLLALVEQAGIEQTQAAHPVPEEERERLAGAEELASNDRVTGPFERICRLAAIHFGVETVAISAIHRDKQEILARTGSLEIPELRENSLGTYALTADERTITVEDTLIDPRFVDVDAIQNANVASYMGATIYAPDDVPVAVLSVYDDMPREFTDADQRYAATLAELIGDFLDRSGRGEPS